VWALHLRDLLLVFGLGLRGGRGGGVSALERQRQRGARALHLRALQLERGRQQLVVHRKRLSLQVDVAHNLEALQLGRRARALHLFHNSSLEPRVATQRGQGPALGDLVLGSPVLADVGVGDNDGNEYAL